MTEKNTKQIDIERIAEAANYDIATIRLIFASAIAKVPALMIGPPGTGKTLLAKTVQGAFSDTNMARLQGHSETSFTDITGKADIPAAMKDGETKTIWNEEWLGANVNFVDEVNRMPMNAQNALLSQMAERMATRVPGQFHEKEDGWWIFTCNYEDDSTFGIMAPLNDRIGVTFTMGHPNMTQFMNPSHDEIVLENYGSIENYWEACKAVKVPKHIEIELKAKLRFTSACRYGEKSEIDQAEACAKCTFRQTPCSMIDGEGFGWRTADATLKLAKAFAVIDNRKSVSVDDVKIALWHALYHRTYGKWSERYQELINESDNKDLMLAFKHGVHHMILDNFIGNMEIAYREQIGQHKIVEDFCRLDALNQRQATELRDKCQKIAGIDGQNRPRRSNKAAPTAKELAKGLIVGIDRHQTKGVNNAGSEFSSVINISVAGGSKAAFNMLKPDFWTGDVEFPFNDSIVDDTDGEYETKVSYGSTSVKCKVTFSKTSIEIQSNNDEFSDRLKTSIRNDDALTETLVQSIS